MHHLGMPACDCVWAANDFMDGHLFQITLIAYLSHGNWPLGLTEPISFVVAAEGNEINRLFRAGSKMRFLNDGQGKNFAWMKFCELSRMPQPQNHMPDTFGKLGNFSRS